MAQHGALLKPYGFVLLALFGLTAVTVLAAYVDFGHPWSDLVALAIALVKATLVVSFFMHVKGSSPLIKLSAVGGFFWVLIFFVIILTDYLERSTLGPGWN